MYAMRLSSSLDLRTPKPASVLPRDPSRNSLQSSLIVHPRTLPVAFRPEVRSSSLDCAARRRISALRAVSQDGHTLKGELDDSPVSVELQPISSEGQFDRVVAEAQQRDESVIVV